MISESNNNDYMNILINGKTGSNSIKTVSKDPLIEAQRIVERILKEEQIGNNPYDRNLIVEG